MRQKKSEINLNDLKQQNADYAVAIVRRDEKIRMLKLTVQELEAQLYSERTARTAVKRLYQGLDRRILDSIHKRGAKKVDTHKTHPVIRPLIADDYRSLIKAARSYDTEEFFMQSVPAKGRSLSFPYYILAQSYVKARDGGVAIAKKAYRKRSNG